MNSRFASCLRATVLVGLFTASIAPPLCAGDLSQQLAIHTYTLRNLTFEQAIEFAQRHGIKELQLTSNHIDPKSAPEEWVKKKAALDAAGVHAYTLGVASTSMKPEENRRLFELAKVMGMKLVVVEPADFRIWDNLEQLAKEFDIRVAVHNHGIKSLYGNPAVVKQVIGHRDARLGVCLDVGWITSSNLDAAKVYREYEGRVFDLHLKDKIVKKTEQGDDVALDTEIGAGQANLKGLFAELQKSGYTGHLALETDGDNFAKSPDDFIDHAKKFVETNGK